MQMGQHSGRLFFGRGIFAFTAFSDIFVCFLVSGIVLDSGLMLPVCYILGPSLHLVSFHTSLW